MRFLEKLYRSPLAPVMSKIARTLMAYSQPRMIYGYDDPASGHFRTYTRISSNVVIMSPKKLSIEDHVWVWHHSILDATEGLSIGEGAQIGAWVGIFTHGSETAIRLLGREFVHIPNQQRAGYTRGAVFIGAFTFIGAGSLILPGIKIGKGVLVSAMTLVNKDIPDYAIVRGQPAKVVDDTRNLDKRFLGQGDFSETYYDRDAWQQLSQDEK